MCTIQQSNISLGACESVLDIAFIMWEQYLYFIKYILNNINSTEI